MLKLELVYFDGCPHWQTARARLEQVAAERGTTVEHRDVTSEEQGLRLLPAGSPTILIDGRDPFPSAAVASHGLACRTYQTPDGPAGSPTVEQLRAAVRAAEARS